MKLAIQVPTDAELFLFLDARACQTTRNDGNNAEIIQGNAAVTVFVPPGKLVHERPCAIVIARGVEERYVCREEKGGKDDEHPEPIQGHDASKQKWLFLAAFTVALGAALVNASR